MLGSSYCLSFHFSKLIYRSLIISFILDLLKPSYKTSEKQIIKQGIVKVSSQIILFIVYY